MEDENKELSKFYRHRILRSIQGGEWRDMGFYFTKSEPDEYIKFLQKNDSLKYPSDYKIIFTHEISEDDFFKMKEYSIPINQYLFIPFYMKF